MPAGADKSPGAADRLRNDRADEANEPPWSGVLSLNLTDDAFLGSCVVAQLAGARLIDLSAAKLALGDHTRAVSEGMVLVQAIVEGAPELASGPDSHASLRAGQVVIRRASADTELNARSTVRVITLAMPSFLLIPRFIAGDAIPAGGALFQGSLAGRLLHDFLVGLSAGAQIQPGRVAPILDAAAALVGLCLAERPPAPVSLSALAAARADEIVRYLERNYANAAMTPASMAEDLGISVRYAHKLLEQTGRSFRQELVALRLKAARRAFSANAHPRQTIADIAISVGFNDLSQFNRHFRNAYAMTPRSARQADEQASVELEPPGPRGARRHRSAAAAPPGRRVSPP
jgi:AraC-like DNA-binding protein